MTMRMGFSGKAADTAVVPSAKVRARLRTKARMVASLRLDVQRLEELAHGVDLVADLRGELVGRAAAYGDAERLELFRDRGVGERLLRLGGDALGDRARQAGGPEEREPGR